MLLEKENEYMITGIVIVEKGNIRRMYIVKPKDWLNPDTNIINAQILISAVQRLLINPITKQDQFQVKWRGAVLYRMRVKI
jgi:hypothetical protein